MRSAKPFGGQDILQGLGIAALVGLFSLIAHKAFHDVGALALQFSGGEFWSRLARYVIANLAGG